MRITMTEQRINNMLASYDVLELSEQDKEAHVSILLEYGEHAYQAHRELENFDNADYYSNTWQ